MADNSINNDTNNISNKKKYQTDAGFIARFQIAFLHPRYWTSWLAIGALMVLALTPARLRDPLLAWAGKLALRFSKGARRRAQINLYYCLPELSEQQRDAIVEQMFITAPQAIVMMAELSLRPVRTIKQRVRWHGYALIEEMQRRQQTVIFLVPHGWAVDIPAMLLTANNQPVTAMFHHQNNPVFDYIWNRARCRFGGRVHARKDGIKPFINSIRHGYWGYYLPDEDYGAEHSHFVDFFATYKATLPAIGRLMKVCRARVIPLFPVYNGKTHQLDIYIRPLMDDLATADEQTIARRMNEEIEQLVRPHPEQYVWLLKLLRTRREGEMEPYQRKDLYPQK